MAVSQQRSIGRVCSRGHVFQGGEPCPVCWPGYRTYEVEAPLWLYPGKEANWHFVTVPVVQSEQIRERFGASGRGWGSLPVSVTIGGTTWKTSLFPDTKAGAYLLPIKAQVRKSEGLRAGQTVHLTVEMLTD